jgi:hypothetical protein
MNGISVPCEGGGHTLAVLAETFYTLSRGALVAGIPVARYGAEGQWLDGGTVYTGPTFDGVLSEIERWANDSVRSAHITGEPT